ncbi:hypothetical protein [Chromobacterium violaceum]|uniref:hypothetical protein n=1 Tax=Chromobacterium violaceum TaxID=536 RepID=UPI0012D45C68|nr:hypothetical protein [Chromobacterium violaceum]
MADIDAGMHFVARLGPNQKLRHFSPAKRRYFLPEPFGGFHVFPFYKPCLRMVLAWHVYTCPK